MTESVIGKGWAPSARVRAAMREVPRRRFVPEAPLETAYHDDLAVVTVRESSETALSSVSDAWLQADRAEQLRLEPGMTVLEVGSGGYNAELLAHLVGERGRVVTGRVLWFCCACVSGPPTIRHRVGTPEIVGRVWGCPIWSGSRLVVANWTRSPRSWPGGFRRSRPSGRSWGSPSGSCTAWPNRTGPIRRWGCGPGESAGGGGAVLLIPHRGETGDEAALPAGYRRILQIVRASGGPVQVKAVGEELGLEVAVRGKLEPLRVKMTKLADRGWLHKRPDGKFTARL
jgi:hypothetical protein